MKLSNFAKLVIAVVGTELAGVVGSVFTVPAISGPSTSSGLSWYAALAKPALNPPSWLFGPAWTILYLLMGISLWLVWREYDNGSPSTKLRVKIALSVFGLQLFLNAIWSPVFFGAHSIGGALAIIVLLWAAIVMTIFVFAKISRMAAYLLMPYILWVTFAAYLNYSIWMLNRFLLK